ncbi:hypothetical protein AX15_007565 [Amanita polypyramis BW_CC]|nr:hypothetical protein AX15_007565 [Amanita polypyramis BW_CC]
MFKFDFDLEDDEETDADNLNVTLLHISDDELAPAIAAGSGPAANHDPFKEITIAELLDALPPKISYSPLSIPLSSGAESLVLPRRDLFDARFQLISEGRDESDTLDLFDAPSDLIPGVYEGGFKTWECSLDLVDYLESNTLPTSFIGKRILEVGCGTAVPSMYLLYKILSFPVGRDYPAETHIHLQDYNPLVLELVTLPNLFITWCLSDASAPFFATTDSEQPDASTPEINITPKLKTAFLLSLQERNISIRFFSGSWETYDVSSINSSRTYDVVLTSETIYRTDSLPSLVSLLRLACIGQDARQSDDDSRDTYSCLVAAKVVYFGVGGGIIDFTNVVEGGQEKGKVETVWERKRGVKRKVLSVVW